jgi:acyl-[acyl-carrier-protein]-phospholipid O-acyltransferase/long-chain-fatty-acid--[acyl-carrier-protein] ligase
MVQFLRRLKSVVIAPEHPVVLGSLLDFAGPRISQRFRRILFRLFGGALAADFHLHVTKTSRPLALLCGIFAGALYRLNTFGLENLPKGGFLLVANHVSGLDTLLLQLACPRPIRFVAIDFVCTHRWLCRVLGLVGADVIPISKDHSKDAIEKAAEHIKNGEIVCVFPEGELSHTGVLLKVQKGFQLIARLAGCEVVPVFLYDLNCSIFPFDDDKGFLENLIRIPLRATIAFGRGISGRSIDHGRIRQEFGELSEFCFQNRPELRTHLGRAIVGRLKRRQFDDAIIDGTNDRRLTRGDLLASSVAVSHWLKRRCPGDRIVVILPPGPGAAIANIAVTLANKVPANLDFNSGRAALQSAIQRTQVGSVICSRPVLSDLEDFPGPINGCLLEEVLAELRLKIIFWRIISLVLPASVLSDLLKLPRKGDRQEAAVFFATTGSGEPSGLVFSHRNVMGNVIQWRSTLKMGAQDSLVASPSFFHSSGCILSLWYPVLEGVCTVTYSEPTNIRKAAGLIEEYGITTLVATPDALHDYLERAEPKQFESIKVLIAGPKKLPHGLGETFERKFRKHISQGFGLIEAGSLISTNLPDSVISPPNDNGQASSRDGSVGKLLPGQAAQIRHPETSEILSPYERGMLWLKGPNIFEGYLNEPEKTAEVLHNGWFQTGELARFDEDGFLYLEGRLSRFPGMTRVTCVEDRLTACSG